MDLQSGEVVKYHKELDAFCLCSFTRGLSGKWAFIMRITLDIEDELQPLEDAIQYNFLPASTGRQAFGDTERELLALPARHGSLGILNPTKCANSQFDASTKVSKPLVSLIGQQNAVFPEQAQAEQREAKATIRSCSQLTATDIADIIKAKKKLSKAQQTALEQASEKGASAWLTAIPIAEYGFSLHKQAFRDALCVRYGWLLARLPSHCLCGETFSVSHALSCP